MDNKIIYQNHINMISIQLLYCMGGYVTYEVTISTGRFCGSCNFCIRTDDSKDCSNSYNIICCNKISNSLFIQDCFNLYECMFCSHIAAKRFCIANMQFEEQEYYEIKNKIIEWILNP